MTVLECGVQMGFVWQFTSVLTTCFRILDCDRGTTGLLIMDPSLPCPLDGGDIGAAVLSFLVVTAYFVLPNLFLLYTLARSSKVKLTVDADVPSALLSSLFEMYKVYERHNVNLLKPNARTLDEFGHPCYLFDVGDGGPPAEIKVPLTYIQDRIGRGRISGFASNTGGRLRTTSLTWALRCAMWRAGGTCLTVRSGV